MESLSNPHFHKMVSELETKVKHSRLVLLLSLENERGIKKESTILEWVESLESRLTGVVLRIKSYLLMFIEGTTDELFKELNTLATLLGEEKKKMDEKCRILQFSDLNKSKILNYLAVLQCPHYGANVYSSKLEVTEKLWCTYKKILELTFQLAKIEKPDAQSFIEKIESKEYVPHPEDLAYFLTDAEATRHIWAYSDFCEFFQSAFKMKLDSEFTWPPSDITANSIY